MEFRRNSAGSRRINVLETRGSSYFLSDPSVGSASRKPLAPAEIAQLPIFPIDGADENAFARDSCRDYISSRSRAQ